MAQGVPEKEAKASGSPGQWKMWLWRSRRMFAAHSLSPVPCHSKVKMDTISGLKSRFWREQVKGPSGPGGGSDSTSTAAAGGGCATPPVSSHWERAAWEAKPNSAGTWEKGGYKTICLHLLKQSKQAAWRTTHMLSPSYLLSYFLLFFCCRNHYREQHISRSLAPASKLPCGFLPAWGGFVAGMLYLFCASSTGAMSQDGSLIPCKKDCSLWCFCHEIICFCEV